MRVSDLVASVFVLGREVDKLGVVRLTASAISAVAEGRII
jgi:hypothetical protein